MEERLDPRIARFLAACRAGDARGAAHSFCVDAIYQEARKGPLLGRAVLEAHFERFFEHHDQRWSLLVEACVVEGPAGAVAYRFLMAEIDGPSVERPGCAFVEFCGDLIHRWREYEG